MTPRRATTTAWYLLAKTSSKSFFVGKHLPKPPPAQSAVTASIYRIYKKPATFPLPRTATFAFASTTVLTTAFMSSPFPSRTGSSSVDSASKFSHGTTDAFCFVGRLRHGLKTRSEEHTSELQSRLHLVCR